MVISHQGFWASLAVSAIFFALFIYFFLPLDEIRQVLERANYWYAGPAVAFFFASLYLRALRWRLLLNPLMGHPRRALFPVVVVGYMANNIFPMRLGEFVRAYYVGMREGVNPAAAFGTLAVERVLDVLTLLLVIALVWTFPGVDLLERAADGIPGNKFVLIGFSVLPFVTVSGLIVFFLIADVEVVLRLVERLSFAVPARVRAKFLNVVERLTEGLTVIRTARAMLGALGLSILVWLLEFAMLYTIALGFDVGSAFDRQVELIAAIALFMAVASLALIVPSTAGGVGPFNFFGAATLVALGVDDTEAGAFVLTAHIALILPVTSVGIIFVMLDRISLRTLLSRRESQDIGK